MKIVVTGGSGFIGTNYIDFLLENEDAEIVNIDKSPPQKKSHQLYWRECNILDAGKTKEIIATFNPDYLVHLAANIRTDLSDIKDFSENIDGVENVLEACKQASNLKRVIFTSSLLVCQVGYYPTHDTDYKPNTAYGESKVKGEEIVRSAGSLPFLWSIIRPISIWGPWCGEPYHNFFKSVLQGWYFHIGSGRYKRSLGYIENSIRQFHSLLKAGEAQMNEKTYYIADPDPTDLHDMSELIREKAGASKIWSMPFPVAKLLAKTGDLLQKTGWRSVPLTSFRLSNVTTEYVYDLSPVMNVAKFTPVPLETGVERMLEHLKNPRS